MALHPMFQLSTPIIHNGADNHKGDSRMPTFGGLFRVKREISLFVEIKILFGPGCLPGA